MISIIIVGYKSKADLKDCLTSIYNSTYTNFRVLFVDNSDDGSVEYIGKNFPKTICIPNHKNLGYAGGNNLLIKKSLELSSDYIFILNADTVLDKNCLQNLINSASEATIFQPLLLLYKKGKTNLINTDGNALQYLGFSYCNNLNENSDGSARKEIPLASGAAMFMPADAARKIGGFDESYFIYHEDADLSIRARLLGYKIMLNPEAKIWHKYSFSKHKSKFYHFERNRLRFLLTNFSLKYLILVAPAFVMNEFVMILYSILGGWFIEKIKSYQEVVKSFGQILKKRREVQKHRKISDRQLKKIIGPRLEFAEFHNPAVFVYNIFLSFWWIIIYIFI